LQGSMDIVLLASSLLLSFYKDTPGCEIGVSLFSINLVDYSFALSSRIVVFNVSSFKV
jgi:hypothetical protein